MEELLFSIIIVNNNTNNYLQLKCLLLAIASTRLAFQYCVDIFITVFKVQFTWPSNDFL